MWRAGRISRSRKTDPSPKADAASADPAASAAGSSAGVATRRIPRPPPPAAALTSNGKPIRSASARIAGRASGRSTETGSIVPGTPSTPTDRASRRAWILSPSASMTAADGPTKTRPGVLDGTGERRSLGQEPVARMDRLGPGRPGCLDDGIDPQVALGRRRRTQTNGDVGHPDVLGVGVGIAVDGHRFHPEFVTRADDPDRDLAPVGDQDPAEGRAGRGHRTRDRLCAKTVGRRGPQSGMLPCFFRGFVSRLSARTASARISRGRVSDGRMTSST